MIASVSSAARDRAALLDRLALEQKGKVVGGAEGPFAGDADEIDATPGIEALQLLEQRHDILALGEMLLELGFVERLWACEQQRLDNAQLLAPVGRWQRHHIGGKREAKL